MYRMMQRLYKILSHPLKKIGILSPYGHISQMVLMRHQQAFVDNYKTIVSKMIFFNILKTQWWYQMMMNCDDKYYVLDMILQVLDTLEGQKLWT